MRVEPIYWNAMIMLPGKPVNNDQWISMLIGFGVVVGLRLLDWAFPKGYVWKKVKKWSEPREGDDDDDVKP